LAPAFGQKGKNKSFQKEALDDVEVLSSVNYPYIELFHKAVREKMSGNFTEAKKLFNDCLKERQDDDAVYFGLAEIAKSENNIPVALENFKKAYAIDPNNNVYLQELAYMHAERANFEEAELLFKKMCELEPRNVDFIYAYSKILIYNKAYELAIEQLDKLQDQTGLVPDLAIMKADLYSELKQPEKAEETLLLLRQEFPDNMEVLKSIIDYYQQQGEDEKAIRLVKELVKDDPKNGAAQYILAKHYLEQKDTNSFIEIAPKLFQLDGIDIEQKLFVFAQLNDILWSDDSIIFDAAKEMYINYPEDGGVIYNYANALAMHHKSKEAVSIYRKVIKKEPSNFRSWHRVLSFERSYLEYQALYEDGMEAINLFPSIPFAYYSAATGALGLNKPDEAIQLLAAGELYLLDDTEQSALFNMLKGQIYFHKKEYKKGIIAFEKARSMDDLNDKIKENYALSLARANIATDVALEQLEKTEIKSKEYYMAKAIIQVNDKQIDDAIETIELGIEKVFSRAELYDLLGDLHYKNNAPQKAKEAWEEAEKYESRNKVLSKKIKEVKYYAPNYN